MSASRTHDLLLIASEHPIEIQGSWFQILLSPAFYSYF